LIVSVASGKGGTGKTLVATSITASVKGAQLLDCDVEEPNAFLFFPEMKLLDRKECTVPVPQIDEKLCVHCGRCAEVCAFNAIAVIPTRAVVFPELCHGCGACMISCPEKAISEVLRRIGWISRARSEDHEIVWGELEPGEARPTPLIRDVRRHANADTVIVDCPPGASCSVVESVRDTDFCLLVAEPTPFGLYDLDLALKLLERLSIPRGVLVNKSGIGTREIYSYLEKRDVPVLMEIPMSREIAELYSRGVIFVNMLGEWRERFTNLAERIREMSE
jgi:MinD superfamily P-loop ATPase